MTNPTKSPPFPPSWSGSILARPRRASTAPNTLGIIDFRASTIFSVGLYCSRDPFGVLSECYVQYDLRDIQFQRKQT